MKVILILLLSLSCLQRTHAQSPSEVVASRILQKMKDTLNLTSREAKNIDSINKLLFERKSIARKKVFEPVELQKAIQQVENTRDSLYQLVLPTQKFIIYRKKKANLVN